MLAFLIRWARERDRFGLMQFRQNNSTSSTRRESRFVNLRADVPAGED
jgi:hypothetical protein